MKRRLISEYTVRSVKIDGVMYELSRMINPKVGDYPEYREVMARRWNGYRWVVAHRWSSR